MKKPTTFWKQRYDIYDILKLAIKELYPDKYHISISSDCECRYFYVYKDNINFGITFIYIFCYDLVGINMLKGPASFIEYIENKLK